MGSSVNFTQTAKMIQWFVLHPLCAHIGNNICVANRRICPSLEVYVTYMFDDNHATKDTMGHIWNSLLSLLLNS